MNLLIVDDHPTNLKLLRAQLEAEGHAVCEAPDGVEALALLERQPVDAVITDILMPRMDGYRLCHEIRKHDRLRDLPVLIYTSTYTSPGDEKLALDVGADKYLVKPASVETLVAVLKGVIAQPHRAPQPEAIGEIEVLKEYSERLVAKLEQKNLELLAAHEQLILQATAMSTAANAIIITDHTGKMIWVNDAFTKLTGYSAAEAIGKTPRILRSGHHDAEFYQEFWQTISSGRTWRGEFTNRRKDRSLFFDEHTVTPVCNDEGMITHYIGIMHDVSARKQAEEELRSTHTKLNMVLSHSPAVLYTLRIEGQTVIPVIVSDNLERLLGVAGQDTSFEWWQDSLHPDDRERVMQIFANMLKGVSYVDEYRLRHRNGTYRWVQDSARVILDAAGQPRGLVGVWTDITERKHMEDALHAEALRCKTLMGLSNDAIHFLDEKGGLIEANPAFYRGLGYTSEEMKDMNVADWDARWTREEMRDRMREVVDHSGAFETRHRRKDGTIFDVEASVTSVRLDGKPLLFCITRDITERKRAEAELRRKTALLEAQVDAAVDGLLVVDPAGNKLLQNQRMVELWKFPPEIAAERDDTRQLAYAVSQTRNPEAFLAKVRHLYAHPDEISHDEVELKDGTALDRYSSPVQGKDGQHYGRIWTFRDVTERKRAEAERLRMARRIELLLDSTGEGIYGIDPEGHCTLINRAGAAMLGWRPEELMGKNMHELMHHHRPDGSHYPLEECAIFRAFRKGEHCRIDTEVFFRKDGTFFPVDYSSYPVRENGVIVGAVVAFNDSSARKQLEAQFLRAQRMESIGSLAGGIAHDLNNALAPIVMASEFLKLTIKDPDAKHVLDTIFDSAKRGAGMVKQILTFARGSEGDRGLVQPKHLVKEMIDIARHTFPKAVEIRTDVASDTWTLQGNPTQLHQILLNLCVNARDAMPKGGTLRLATGNVRLDALCAQLSPDAKPGPYVLVTVTDTGTGMPPEVRARIFEAFFTTKEPGKGTGLGLSTVLSIVREHGGFLTVDSDVGKGTTFRVYLPAEATSAADAVAPAPPALPSGNGELILVVDDEAGVLRIAEQTLLAFGYRVVVANDGTQAMGVAAQHRDTLRLLLTDMAMPYMDGKVTTRAMRQLLPRLPVIVASGSDALADAPLRQELDVQAFLAKPYSAESLLRTVHEVLHGRDEQ